MVSQPSISNAVDPLDGGSILSLFPRTLKKLPTDPKALDSVRDGNDNSTCLHLKAAVLKSPAKFLEEAKTILNDSSETVRAFYESAMVVDRRAEAADVVIKERPRERRPGLGLKRAKFSFKPKSSQPSANLECEIDIEKYPDPESFFDAVRRMERAKKEIQKLRGGALTELDQNIPSRAERRQRHPGLYGDREPVSYKHRYQIEAFDIDKTLLSSQETPGQGTHSQSCNSMLPETNDHDISPERQRASGNVSAAEKNEDDLFDKLMSDNCVVDEDGAVNMLDGDRAENTLQELLQIKPLDLDDTYLPEMHDIRRIEPKTLSETLPNPRVDKSVLHEMMTLVPVDTSCGSSQVAGKSINYHLSPTLPKSPLASISSLQRHITQTLVTNDPFTFVDTGSSPLGISSLKELARKESDPIDKGVPTAYGELDSHVCDEDSADQIARGELNEPALRDSLSSKEIMSDNATLGGGFLDIRRVDSDCLNNGVGDRVMDNNLGDHHDDVVCAATGPKDLGNEVSEFVQSLPAQLDLPGPVMQISAAEESSVKVDPPLGVHEECLGLATEETPEACDVRKGGRAKATSHMVDSNMTLKRKSKAVPDRSCRRKELCRRQSLAGAGTNWDCGLRRSTRIRLRPLEYWKGERMLYGRVHESLITAIGVKYMSPSKDGPQMKVKSYVSDEYKDLVDQVALH